MKKLIEQIVRFGIVGGSATLIDYGIMVLMTEIFGVNYLLSSTISFTISLVWNYVLSIKWVFTVKDNLSQTTQFTVFIILSLIGLGLNTLFMWIFVDGFSMNYLIAKIIATLLVMVYNFITRKIFLEGN